MEFLTKSRIATVLVVAASSALFAQNSGPDKLQDYASIPDARHIIGQSVVATERSLQALDRYSRLRRDLQHIGWPSDPKLAFHLGEHFTRAARSRTSAGSGSRVSNPVVLDGIIRGTRAARLAHRPAADERW